MDTETFDDIKYNRMVDGIYSRFPSFQSNGSPAYNPGLSHMEFIDQLAGHPHRRFRTVHVAGTNGKGSVSNMLASVLASTGLKVGLYTSPHILDLRERMRILTPEGHELISRRELWDYMKKWEETFEHVGMSFFEITTSMAFAWFADRKVDVAVIETGLGGRLDSTNIITPELSVITNIGFDHCDILGSTLPEIAFEKAGIIKPRVPVIVGESDPLTTPVFDRKVLYTNMPETCFSGDRKSIMSLLTYASETEPSLWKDAEALLARMDLQGSYQRRNLRTVLAAVDVLAALPAFRDAFAGTPADTVEEAIAETAHRAGFHGRWEMLRRNPDVICDIGHNEHGLKYNFAQLTQYLEEGRYDRLIMVYGSVSDKDVDAVLRILPQKAAMFFTNADNRRAMPAEEVCRRFHALTGREGTICRSVPEAVKMALDLAADGTSASPLIYVGGSTYVVAEAVDAVAGA